MRQSAITCIALLLILTCGLALAQSGTSRVTGVVQDKTGAIVPGAAVTLTNEGTQIQFKTTSSSQGVYAFDGIQSGSYSISAEGKGFSKYTSKGNVLSVGQPMTVNAIMQVGASSETVEVSGTAEQVQTSTSGNSGNVVDSVTIQTLPIVGSRGRNPLNFLNYQPGVVNTDGAGGGVHVHGARDRAWNFTLDGVDNNETSAGGSNFAPLRTNPDAISEFRVITGNPTAENGRNSGAQVTMVTKSGTNAFHGNAFFFYQSPFLQANEISVINAGLKRPQFLQNIGGGSIGGPIIKNKTFFFTNVQLLHTRRSRIVNSRVYTQLARQGQFRYVSGGKNGPAGSPTAAVDANGDPLPGLNVTTYTIPGQNGLPLDPAVQAVLGKTPMPNDFTTLGDGLNIASFTWTAPELEKQVDEVVKIDHVFNASHSIFGRWSSGHQNTVGDFVNGGWAPFPTSPNVVDTLRTPRNLALNWRWNLNPRMTNEFIAGMNRFGFNFANPDSNFKTNTPLVLNDVTMPFQNYIGNARFLTTFQLADNFTTVHGAHTLKFGTNMRYQRHIDQRGSIGSLNAQPFVDFSTSVNSVNYGALPGQFATPTGINTSVDRATLSKAINNLLGRYGNVAQGFVANLTSDTFNPPGTLLHADFRLPEYDFYFQDSWKVKDNLVVDLGLRWEIKGTPTTTNNSIFRPDQRLAVGSPSTNNAKWVKGSLYNTDWNNFGPSIGFAWDPFHSGKTSVRGNYRVAFDRMNTFALSSGIFQGMPGLVAQVTKSTGGLLSGGLPSLTPTTTPSALRTPPAFSTNSMTVIDPIFQTPTTNMWEFGIQREIARNTVVSVSYLGRHGSHLIGGYDANAVDLTSNGFLDAFNLIKSGQSSTLMNTLLANYPGKPSAMTGSQWLLAGGSPFQTNLTTNSIATMAATISQKLGAGSVPVLTLDGLPTTFFQAFPQFTGAMNVIDSGDESNYHAMEAQISHRYSGGLSYQFSYTLSKSLDNRSFDPTFTRVARGAAQSASATPYNIKQRSLNYARSDFDRRHAVQGAFVYELPFGNGKRWLHNGNGLLDRVIGGWEYAGIVNLSSGRPFTIYSGSNTFSNVVQTPASCSGGACAADMGHIHWIGGIPYLIDPITQKSNFTVPAAGSLGNKGRNAFKLPHYFDMDMAIGKKTRITENQFIETRLEMQNAFNNVMYSLPESSIITSSVFGRERGAGGYPSRKMQLSLKYTF